MFQISTRPVGNRFHERGRDSFAPPSLCNSVLNNFSLVVKIVKKNGSSKWASKNLKTRLASWQGGFLTCRLEIKFMQLFSGFFPDIESILIIHICIVHSLFFFLTIVRVGGGGLTLSQDLCSTGKKKIWAKIMGKLFCGYL